MISDESIEEVRAVSEANHQEYLEREKLRPFKDALEALKNVQTHNDVIDAYLMYSSEIIQCLEEKLK